MSWGANSWIRAVPETVYGVYDVTQLTSALWFRLPSDNAFDMMPEAQRYEIKSADGGNRRVQNVSSRTKVAGNLKTLLYPTQAGAILAWATALTSNDLGSYTCDHFDSFEACRYLGVKVGSLDIECGAESNEGTAMLSLGLVAQKADGTAPTLTQPAFSVFPAENPYVLQESSTGLLFPTARTKYKSFKMSLKNTLAATFDELPYISNLTYCGRTLDVSADLQYVAATDRTAYEAQTAQILSCLFTKASPAHTLLLDFQGQARISKRGRTVPLGDVSRQHLDMSVFFDGSASTDFSYTAT